MPSSIMRIAGDLLGPWMDNMVAKKMEKKRKHRADGRARAHAEWHARLPPARRQPPYTSRSAEISAQPQSRFFSMLPLELRQLIYSYALGGHDLQLQVSIDEESFTTPFRLSCLMAQPLFGLPSSCKMAYMEAAHVIYESNTFRIPDITAFFCFQRLLPLEKFQAIQSIHFRWAYREGREFYDFLDGPAPWGFEYWKQVWHEISNMKGLKQVKVDLWAFVPFMLPEYEDCLFSEMEDIPGAENMQVRVSWEEGWEKCWPFPVERGVKGIVLPGSDRQLLWGK